MKKVWLFLVLFLLAVGSVVAKVPAEWDRSSLEFGKVTHKCQMVDVEICNSGESMNGTSSWQVFFSDEGKPKDGVLVGSGTIPVIEGGECATVSFATSTYGSYIFVAEQREGHPGQGELWSEVLEYDGCHDNEDGDGEPEVPEFGLFAGLLAVGGCGVVALFLRRV